MSDLMMGDETQDDATTPPEPPKAPKPVPETAEEKEARMVREAAGNAALKAGEKAASTLNQVTKKNLEAWLKIGEAMVALAKIAGGNTKIQGKLVAPYPEFASIPAPIRSNAKWLHENIATVEKYRAEGFTYRPKGEKADVTLHIKGDHPTSIREQFRKIEEAMKESGNGGPRPGESEEEYEARKKDEEKKKEEEQNEVVEFNRITQKWLDTATGDDMTRVLAQIRNGCAENAGARKKFLKLIKG